MPVSLGYIPEGEVLLEPSDPSSPLPIPPINPTPSPRRCTMEVGSVRDPVTGEMVQYYNGCQKADILAGTYSIPTRGGAGGLVAPYSDQSSADVFVELVNQTGEDATMRMAEGIVTRYLEGVAMGAILFDSAVSQKLFDINADKM